MSSRNADGAIGQVQGIASIGQILGPFVVAAIAQAAGLRVGLFILPGLVLLAALGLHRHHRRTQLLRRRVAVPREGLHRVVGIDARL